MSWVRDIQLLAMRDVLHGTEDYNLRHIFRWYSRTFHTPLFDVEDLPLHDVLQHYFECRYEDLEDQDREAEIQKLLLSPEKLARMRRAEDAEDAEAFAFGREAEAAVAKAPAAPAPEVPVDPIGERLRKIREELMPAASRVKDALNKLPVARPEEIPEGIHMQFEDVDVPDLDDAPSFGPSEKPKKTQG